jgi:hypothetical protein
LITGAPSEFAADDPLRPLRASAACLPTLALARDMGRPDPRCPYVPSGRGRGHERGPHEWFARSSLVDPGDTLPSGSATGHRPLLCPEAPLRTLSGGCTSDVRAWKQRPLDDVYSVVFLDALVLKIREGGSVQRRACYLALGVTVEGERDVLGMLFQETEGAKFWMQVLFRAQAARRAGHRSAASTA